MAEEKKRKATVTTAIIAGCVFGAIAAIASAPVIVVVGVAAVGVAGGAYVGSLIDNAGR